MGSPQSMLENSSNITSIMNYLFHSNPCWLLICTDIVYHSTFLYPSRHQKPPYIYNVEHHVVETLGQEKCEKLLIP